MTSLTEVGDALRANQMPWGAIPQAYKDTASRALLPAPSFTEEQRHWFARWWLACTQADVDAINALLPSNVRASAVQINAGLYLNSDLLTDSLVPGNTYYPAQSVLFTLVCTNFDPPPVFAQEGMV